MLDELLIQLKEARAIEAEARQRMSKVLDSFKESDSEHRLHLTRLCLRQNAPLKNFVQSIMCGTQNSRAAECLAEAGNGGGVTYHKRGEQ